MMAPGTMMAPEGFEGMMQPGGTYGPPPGVEMMGPQPGGEMGPPSGEVMPPPPEQSSSLLNVVREIFVEPFAKALGF